MDGSCSSCSICFQYYDFSERKPLVLPCSHSFCQQCLLQLEMVGDKLCPNCRKSWRSFDISNLVTCYQLIQEHAPEESRNSDVCLHQGVRASFWCNSCNVPLCKKCLTDSHKECQWVLIEDKCAELKSKYIEMLKQLKDKYHNFANNIPKLKQDFDAYQQDLNSWHAGVKSQMALLDTDNSDVTLQSENSVARLQQLIDRIQNIQKPKKPNHILYNIMEAYAVTQNGSAETFISNFKASLRTSAAVDSHTDDEDVEEQIGNAILEPVVLEEGSVWTLRHCHDTNAVISALTNTSVRPYEVRVQRTKWKVEEAKELMEVLSLVKCYLKIRIYECFWKHTATNSIAQTWMSIEQLFKPNRRCALVELWGHLDSDGLKRLPTTVKRIGLTLSSASDMNAVNDLSEVAFYNKDQDKLWPNLKEIDLSILQTFQPNDWKLTWEWRTKRGVLKRSGMAYLHKLDISMALHFPNLKATNIDWMMDIMSNVTNKFVFVGVIQKVYLPRTELSADAVLGVLRDSGLECVVHLPSSHTEDEEERKLVEKTYRKHNFKLVWDAGL